MATVEEIIVSMEARMEGYRREVRAARQETSRAMDDIGKSTKRAELLVSTAARAMSAALAGISVVAIGRAAVQTALDFKRLEQGMRIATGSSEKADAEFSFLRKTADQLGIRLLTLAEQYVGLAAAARGTTLEGQATRDIFDAITRAVIATGGGAEQAQGALLAVQQIISKGTVSAEELRGQLGERLPGAFQIAARAVGKTTAELGKMLEQGQLLSADFLPRFAAQLREELPSSVEAANAPFQRLRTVLDDISNSTADGFIGALSEATDELASVLKRMDEDGSLRRLGEDIAAVIRIAASGLSTLDRLATTLNTIANNPRKAGYSIPDLIDRGIGVDRRGGKKTGKTIEQQLREQIARDEALLPKTGKGSAIADEVEARLEAARQGLVALQAGKVLELKATLDRVNAGVIKVSKEARANLEKELAAAMAALSPDKAAPIDPRGTPLGTAGKAKKPKAPKQSALDKYRESTDYAFEAKQDIKDFIDSTKEIDLANVRIGKTISFTEYLGESFKEVAEIVDRDIGRAFDDLEERNRRLDQVAQEFASSMQSAFEDSILRGDLDGAFDGLLEDMARLIIRLTIIEPLAKSVADALKGGGSGGGFIGSILGSIGAALGGGTTGKATGGAVHPGQMVRVGEHGAEVLRMGSVGGYVSPMPAGRGGDGGTVLSVTINAPGATAETVSMIRREINNAAGPIINAASSTTMQRATRRTLPRGLG